MKIAVIGGGGREHAVIKALKKSPGCSEIIAIPGNGGIAADAKCVDISATNVIAVVQYCEKENVDYVVVTPDDPLALGMVDALADAGIPAFGPSKGAAQIEASKVFSKNLMKKYGIPTAAYHSFDDVDAALAYVDSLTTFPVVVKADGLALGKGVLICEDAAAAANAVRGMMVDKMFGKSGARVVVEEFITGPEVSVLAFCDGQTLVPMVSSMDHKRALDGDEGLNTGGMGTVAPNPYYTEEIAALCNETIYRPTVEALIEEGVPFKGCLYFGLMLTADGPKVIEYNCRFGDPETQVVLPLLQSDLLEIMTACTDGRLTADLVQFADGAAACVVMASGGYPSQYSTGFAVTGIGKAEEDGDVSVFSAGTKLMDGKLVTSGGRVLGVTATAPTLTEAVAKAYTATKKITFEGAHYRTDIGKKALEANG